MVPSNLATTIENFARRLRREFSVEIQRNPRAFKYEAVRILKAALPPKPGRPCSEVVTRASQMRAHGKSWKEIYAACLLQIAAPDSRQAQQFRLRCAVRSRRNPRRCKKSASRFFGK
jgi:hypothetical protein